MNTIVFDVFLSLYLFIYDISYKSLYSIYVPTHNTNSLLFIDVIGTSLDKLFRAVRNHIKVLFGGDFL